MRPALRPAALLLAFAIAGCMEAPGPAEPDGGEAAWPERLALPDDPMPEGPGHDHADPSQHKFLWHYEPAAHDPLLSNAANAAGLHALDLQAGHLFGAAWGSHAASVDGGLVIWDLADPLHPVEVGRLTLPGSVGGDRSVEATPDGAFVVLGTEAVTCAGQVNPLGAVTAYLVDVRDKAAPRIVDALSGPGAVTLGDLQGGSTGKGGVVLGTHSVTVAHINGTDWAFVWGKVYRIERTEAGGALVYVRDVEVGHDLFIRPTPWNTTWGLAANEDKLLVHDLTDPADPHVIGQWQLPEGASTREGRIANYMHTADALFLDDGRGGTKTVVLQTSEDVGDHVSPLYTLDGDALRHVQRGDEPATLETLGGWTNPGKHAAGMLTFSLHDPRVHDGLATLSHYHGGLWQLDLRNPDFWADPAPIAYAVYADGEVPALRDPAERAVASALCGIDGGVTAPSTVDQEVSPEGLIYAADVFGGLYTFKPTADHPVYGHLWPEAAHSSDR